MLFSPPSLYNIILDFVSCNVEVIESLVGFPELTGEAIFRKTVNKRLFLSKDMPVRISIAKKFTEAYKEHMLTSLSIRNSLIVINEFLEPLMVLTEGLVELDISCNHLGDNHDFITHISRLHRLKRLSIKQNDLTDNAIRKLTLPIKIFNKGLLNIEELDLSGNFFTAAIVPWLTRFPCLTYVNLSATNLTDEAFNTIQKSNGMHTCVNCCFDVKPIETKGWANELISQWKTFCVKVKVSRKLSTADKFYSKELKRKRTLCFKQPPICNENRCFVKLPVSDDPEKIISVKRHKMSTSVVDCKSKGLTAIEQELFEQYM